MAALILKQIERGTVQFASTDTTATVNLSTTLDSTAKTILIFSVNCGSPDAEDYNVLGRVVSTSQIQFERAGIPGAVCDVSYQVVEFLQGLTVQHFYFTQTAATVNTTISDVTLSRAFPILSMAASGSTFGGNDVMSAEISTTTNLVTFMGSYASCIVAVQIVDIDDATVQKFTGSYGTTDTCDITVSSITENKTFWFFTISQTGAFAWTDVPYLYYVNNTTLRFFRSGSSGAANHSYVVYVVSLSAGVTVQNISTVIASSGNTVSPTISDVTVNNTALLDNSLHQRMGMSAETSDDSGANHILLTNLTSTQFTATRIDSPATSFTTNVQVLEFLKSVVCVMLIQEFL